VAKILVADDNSNIQKMVGLALKDQGIDVVAVGNGEAAVRKISDLHPDLVLADVFMPVRNGYEVCRYVKEDSKLSHIPVILLVGAFDPLDEQEAQRVGADGVLKKPFVPPDPLISMVKSALARAGVNLGPTAHSPEKSSTATTHGAAEILKSGMGSKVAAAGSEKLTEAEPEPLPAEFPTPPPQFKIAAGHEPVAFGSLLQTPEEEEAAFLTTGTSGLAADRNWGSNGEEVEEEVEGEDESSQGGWRPDGLDHVLEKSAQSSNPAPDWPDKAFRGSSPATDAHVPSWMHAPEPTQFAEVAAVAISTVESTPAAPPTPFSGDAWAAAMAAGVEEKLAKAVEQETAAPSARVANQEPASAITEIASVPAVEKPGQTAHVGEASPTQSPAQGLSDNWFSISSSPWGAEAHKASLLAASWDAPAVAPAEAATAEPVVHEDLHPESAAAFYSPEPIVAPAHDEEHVGASEVGSAYAGAASEPKATEHDTISVLSMHRAASGAEDRAKMNETQEVPVYQAAAPNWSAPAAVEGGPTLAEEAPAIEHEAPVLAEVPTSPNMDELVARVLEKMNPDMLQRVTREILKPVIEAIIQDELKATKL